MRGRFINIAIIVAFGFVLCFAQGTPEKLAVYVSGASEAGINKSFSNKLLATLTHGGEYVEIADPGLFQDELYKSGKSDIAYVSQVAKRHGADYVCIVNIVEVFGAHSINARLLKIAGSQIVRTGSADRPLKSLEDLTAVSNELTKQLLPPASPAAVAPPVVVVAPPAVIAPPVVAVVPPVAAVVPVAPPVEFAVSQQDTVQPNLIVVPAPVVVQNQCAKTYNVNELIFKIKDGFPAQLKDCSSTLAKDMVTPAAFGGKKLEPNSFMTQCVIDRTKKELPDGFPGTDKILGSLTYFVQGLLNSAIVGGTIDPKKLLSTIASMNIEGTLSDVRKLAVGECVVDEPYEPSVALPTEASSPDAKESSSGEGKSKGISFGIRAGINLSHTYAEYYGNYGKLSEKGSYNDILGMQLGFVLDFAVNEMFHIQPNLMYVQKGMNDSKKDFTAHYIELPLLLSLKLAAFRLNAGPYYDFLVSGNNVFASNDIGLSMGFGFDIGMFYAGVFYDYGFLDVSNKNSYNFYNRTLGLNFGVNL